MKNLREISVDLHCFCRTVSHRLGREISFLRSIQSWRTTRTEPRKIV